MKRNILTLPIIVLAASIAAGQTTSTIVEMNLPNSSSEEKCAVQINGEEYLGTTAAPPIRAISWW